jgi:hypothetical protein
VRLVLDAGALIGIDRSDRRMAGLVELGRRAEAALVTTAPVVGQAWRDGARQARLARHLRMIDVEVVGVAAARSAGELLAAAGTSDVVDALLADLMRPGDQVLTSDPTDLSALVRTRGVDATVVAV